MSRRQFVAGLGAAALVGGQALAQEGSVRPNILFALADDWSWPQSHGVEDLSLIHI